MSDLDSLIQNIYEYFQKRYGLDTGGLGPGSLFLAFEKLGTNLSASDFKLQPEDAEFNPAVALQHGSDLADFVAQIDSEGFILPRADLSPSVSGQYGSLLSDATRVPQPGRDGDIASFLQMKGQAQKQFDASKTSMNLTEFWPASYTPKFWFNDRDPTIWTAYKYSVGQSTGPQSTGPPRSPQSTGPPKVVLGNWKWRVVTADAAPRWDAVSRMSTVHTSEIRARVVATPAADSTRTPAGAGVEPGPVRRIDPRTLKAVAPMARDSNLGATVALSPAVAKAIASTIQPVRGPARVSPILLRNVARAAVAMQLPTQHVSSNNFEISFDYCLVDITRSWLSSNLLNAGQWFLPNKSAGDLAGGKYENSIRPFGFLPAKLIVVRNLKISAQWSQEDRVSIQSAASLGPFSLVSRDFNGYTLASPGMQIIGWLCQVMPILPPASDPSIS